MNKHDKTTTETPSRRESLGWGLGIAALAGFFESTAQAEEQDDDVLFAEIEEVLRQTQDRWNGGDTTSLKEVWDADDPEPWYIPEEIVTPFTSWDELDDYWSPRGGRGLEYFKWGFGDLKVKRLAPDIALAMFQHFYEYQLPRGIAPPSGGFDRCLAIFRKKPEGWRHILYAQCPLGPEAYVRALRTQAIQPDFDTFRQRVLDGQ